MLRFKKMILKNVYNNNMEDNFVEEINSEILFREDTRGSKMLTFTKNSKQRKKILNSLRKKGNYLENSENGKLTRKKFIHQILTVLLRFFSAKNVVS